MSATYETTSGYYKLQLVLDETATSPVNNTSTVSYTLSIISLSQYASFSGLRIGYSINFDGTVVASQENSASPYYSLTGPGVLMLVSGTATVQHNPNGSKTINALAAIAPSRSDGGPSAMSVSGAFTLTNFGNASTLTAADGTLGVSQTLTVNRAHSGLTHALSYSCGALSGQTAGLSRSTGIAASVTFTPPMSLAAQAPNGTTVTVTFTLVTIEGGTTVGSKQTTITCAIPASVAPTVSAVLTDTTGAYSTYGAYVQNKSRVGIAITAAGAQGSTITGYLAQVDGKNYSGSASLTSDVLQSSGALTVTVTVTDSRGRTGTYSADILSLTWAPPRVLLSAYRCASAGTEDPSGAYMRIVLDGTVDSLSGQNSSTHVVKYRTGGGSWTTISGSGPDVTTQPIAASISSSWEIEATVTDELGSTSSETILPIAFVLMDFRSTGMGVTFGAIATVDGVVVSMPVIIEPRTYLHAEDSSEAAVETWLNGVLSAMPDRSCTPCLIQCGAWPTASQYIGELRRISSTEASFIGETLDGTKAKKRLSAGTWQAATTL